MCEYVHVLSLFDSILLKPDLLQIGFLYFPDFLGDICVF